MFGLFKKKKLPYAVNLGNLVTDMHSHLIPGIDDGSPNMETSVQLIRGMKALGYKKLITTPHISSDMYKNTPEIIQQGLVDLQKRLEEENIDIEVVAAAEYLLDDGFETLMKDNQLLTFSNKFILVEMPFFHLPPNLFDITFELQIKKYKIILAHPERYLFFYNDFSQLQALKDRGIYFQMNMISLTGHYSAEVKKMAEKLVDNEMIDFLGSDLHNPFYLDLLSKTRYEIYLQKVMKSGAIQNHLL